MHTHSSFARVPRSRRANADRRFKIFFVFRSSAGKLKRYSSRRPPRVRYYNILLLKFIVIVYYTPCSRRLNVIILSHRRRIILLSTLAIFAHRYVLRRRPVITLFTHLFIRISRGISSLQPCIRPITTDSHFKVRPRSMTHYYNIIIRFYTKIFLILLYAII